MYFLDYTTQPDFRGTILGKLCAMSIPLNCKTHADLMQDFPWKPSYISKFAHISSTLFFERKMQPTKQQTVLVRHITPDCML